MKKFNGLISMYFLCSFAFFISLSLCQNDFFHRFNRNNLNNIINKRNYGNNEIKTQENNLYNKNPNLNEKINKENTNYYYKVKVPNSKEMEKIKNNYFGYPIQKNNLQLIKPKNNQDFNIKLREYPTDDMMEERIHKKIIKYAEILAKKSDLRTKRIKNGILPENFPEEVRKKAFAFRSNKKNFNLLMKYPAKVWGFCQNPLYKLNSLKKCDSIYATKSPEKLNDCKNSFCNVCCDNLSQIFQMISKQSRVAKLLMLNKKSGLKRIGRIITNKEINICKKECHKNFPIRKVFIMPSPPRLLNLGLFPHKSAKSCADIKKWGDPKAKSGIYWIDLGMKGKTKAFCDMETDNGGWTLFFNYKYDFENKSFNKILIDSTKIPESLDDNSHINLGDAGFSNDDINELRFYCEENAPKKTFMHFKISNYYINQLAITGDQTKIIPKQWRKSYKDLIPNKLLRKHNRIMNNDNVADIDINGTNLNGGFWNTPFGISNKNVFWSVIGENKGQPRLECGNMHRDLMSGENINVKTHHSIWFRGEPMKPEDSRIRYMNYNKIMN